MAKCKSLGSSIRVKIESVYLIHDSVAAFRFLIAMKRNTRKFV